jgi:hypothetical protein
VYNLTIFNGLSNDNELTEKLKYYQYLYYYIKQLRIGWIHFFHFLQIFNGPKYR